MNENTLFDNLEICLQNLAKGADLETCLKLFPGQVDDLRPLLIAALEAQNAIVKGIPEAVQKRGKERMLLKAAELRATDKAVVLSPKNNKTTWSKERFYRLAVIALVVLAFLLSGGTGLVSASSNTLPGDRLYPVKRSWEGVQLFFVVDPNTRTTLQNGFEQERVHEIEELYAEKRFEQVNFTGVVQSCNLNICIVEGLQVITPAGKTIDPAIVAGSMVWILGETDDGLVEAEKFTLISGSAPSTSIQNNEVPPTGEAKEDLMEPTESPDAIETPEATEVQEKNTLEPESTLGVNPTPEKEAGSPTEIKLSEQSTSESTQENDSNTKTTNEGG